MINILNGIKKAKSFISKIPTTFLLVVTLLIAVFFQYTENKNLSLTIDSKESIISELKEDNEFLEKEISLIKELSSKQENSIKDLLDKRVEVDEIIKESKGNLNKGGIHEKDFGLTVNESEFIRLWNSTCEKLYSSGC